MTALEHEWSAWQFKIIQVHPIAQHQPRSWGEHIWNIYGVASGTVFLIRPDGYIGFLGNTGSASQVKDYLQKCTRK